MKVLKPEFVHTDIRRTIKQLVTADLKQINIYTAKKDSILGRHFHKETNEYFFVIKGQIYAEIFDIRTGEPTSKIFDAGDMFVVQPFEVHTIECMTEAKIMTFLDKAYSEQNPDIHKYTEAA